MQSKSPRRHWLCIAYAFPPINRSGTHRTLAFVRHLDKLGWDATVLTVEPDGEPTDEALLDCVPASTTVVRTHWVDLIPRIKAALHLGGMSALAATARGSSSEPAHGLGHVEPVSNRLKNGSTHRRGLSDWITRLLVTPDSRLGWILPGVRGGLQAIRRRRPDVIYSTSPCLSAHLIALLIGYRTRLPWVADFRDPWRGNPFRDLGYRSLERWDAWLERQVLRRARHVIGNTEPMTEDLHRRMPFVADRCTTIMNGYDVERFQAIKPRRICGQDQFVLTHCGQFYGPRSPGVWFEALRRAVAAAPRVEPVSNRLKTSSTHRRSCTLSADIHLVFLGPDSYNGRRLADLADDAGVGDRVHVLGNKSHKETLSYMAGSDALMLAGSAGVDRELQVPSKLFEYLAVRKPIIAAVSAGSPAVGILRSARAEALVCTPDDADAIAAAMARLAELRRVPVVNAWSGVEVFSRSQRAAELAAIFARLAGSPTPHPLPTPGRTACFAAPVRELPGATVDRTFRRDAAWIAT